MPEWLKILITALSAFAVGILSDPIKTVFNEQLHRNLVRRRLYRKLSFLYVALLRMLSDHTKNRTITLNVFDQLETSLFHHYASTDKGTFLQLKDSWGIKRAFESIELLHRRAEQGDMEEFQQAVRATVDSLNHDMERGYLDKTLLHSFLDDEEKRLPAFIAWGDPPD
jgi:hypothetical protein